MTIAHSRPRCFDHSQVFNVSNLSLSHSLRILTTSQNVCGERLFLSTAPLDRDMVQHTESNMKRNTKLNDDSWLDSLLSEPDLGGKNNFNCPFFSFVEYTQTNGSSWSFVLICAVDLSMFREIKKISLANSLRL